MKVWRGPARPRKLVWVGHTCPTFLILVWGTAAKACPERVEGGDRTKPWGKPWVGRKNSKAPAGRKTCLSTCPGPTPDSIDQGATARSTRASSLHRSASPHASDKA